jgi:hypothetical protein
MPRPRQRVCLQEGLKLDLNRLIHRGSVRPAQGRGLTSFNGQTTTPEKSSGREKSHPVFAAKRKAGFALKLMASISESFWSPVLRHFGGAQWYFICPVMNRRASVLWMPPGAERFCSRQTSGGRVIAYRSQFLGPDDRAHAGQAKIKARLIGDCDPAEWDLPPKPKWMRWRTYNRYVERYDAYEDILDQGIIPLMAKFLGRSG